jgi:hypothetical protein
MMAARSIIDEICDDLPSIDRIKDQNIIFYISGYLAKSISKGLKCENCQNLLKGKNELQILLDDKEDEDDDEELIKSSFLEQVNRGGLVEPSDLLFIVALQIWNFYCFIMNCDETKGILFNSKKSRNVFAEAYLLWSEKELCSFGQEKCSSGHEFKTILRKCAVKLYNCFAKNFCNEKNSSIHSKKKCNSSAKDQSSSKSQRKVKKLQSSSK